MNNSLPTLAAISVVFVLSMLDNYTTWFMLSSPIPGWDVVEANPIAKALFDYVGLETGLLLDAAFTTVACIWGYKTKVGSENIKLVVCAVLALVSLVAVINNSWAILVTGAFQ